MNVIGDNFKISYPFFSCDIVRATDIDYGYKLKIVCDKNDFEKYSQNFGTYSYEMPSYSDLTGILLSSGVIKFSNFDDFKDEYVQRRKLMRSKRLVFSADTNMFYNRFFSVQDLEDRVQRRGVFARQTKIRVYRAKIRLLAPKKSLPVECGYCSH